MHFFYDNRRLLAGVLLSAALLSGCAPKNNSQGSDQSSADVSTSENNPGGDVSQPDGSSVTANGSASLPEDGSPAGRIRLFQTLSGEPGGGQQLLCRRCLYR